MVVGLTIFTLVAPIGMTIGWATGKELPALVNVILLALTSGMYLYFACSEVIVKEFHNGKDVVIKIVAILLAVAIILGLVFIESAHSHGTETIQDQFCAS